MLETGYKVEIETLFYPWDNTQILHENTMLWMVVRKEYVTKLNFGDSSLTLEQHLNDCGKLRCRSRPKGLYIKVEVVGPYEQCINIMWHLQHGC